MGGTIYYTAKDLYWLYQNARELVKNKELHKSLQTKYTKIEGDIRLRPTLSNPGYRRSASINAEIKIGGYSLKGGFRIAQKALPSQIAKLSGQFALIGVAVEGTIITYRYYTGDINEVQFQEEVTKAALTGALAGGTYAALAALAPGVMPSPYTPIAILSGATIVASSAWDMIKQRQNSKRLSDEDAEFFGFKLSDRIEPVAQPDLFQ